MKYAYACGLTFITKIHFPNLMIRFDLACMLSISVQLKAEVDKLEKEREEEKEKKDELELDEIKAEDLGLEGGSADKLDRSLSGESGEDGAKDLKTELK